MSWLTRFLSQPRKAYRDFQIVFGLLGLHFIIPALGYLFVPDAAVAGFVRLGDLLGGEYYPFYERSYLWRILGGTNVLTLGFLCLFVQADVRRHWPALYPLVFMKGTTSLGYLCVFAVILRYPAFLAIAAWDALNCAAFVYFARKAWAEAEDESTLVPRPWGAV